MNKEERIEEICNDISDRLRGNMKALNNFYVKEVRKLIQDIVTSVIEDNKCCKSKSTKGRNTNNDETIKSLLEDAYKRGKEDGMKSQLDYIHSLTSEIQLLNNQIGHNREPFTTVTEEEHKSRKYSTGNENKVDIDIILQDIIKPTKSRDYNFKPYFNFNSCNGKYSESEARKIVYAKNKWDLLNKHGISFVPDECNLYEQSYELCVKAYKEIMNPIS